jgi:hypothetical protein
VNLYLCRDDRDSEGSHDLLVRAANTDDCKKAWRQYFAIAEQPHGTILEDLQRYGTLSVNHPDEPAIILLVPDEPEEGAIAWEILTPVA